MEQPPHLDNDSDPTYRSLVGNAIEIRREVLPMID